MSGRVLILCLGMATAMFFTAANSETRIGEVKSAQGEAAIERDGAEIPAEPGVDLFQADVVRTGPDGSLGMTFTDNSRMSLGPSSELALEKYLFSGRRKAFDARLTRGSMTAASGQIAKEPMAMRILMPTGVLGVRGTEIAVRVAE